MSVGSTNERFAKTNGVELCYETFGDPARPPLVLIMGLGAQMVLWDDEFCEQLAARGFHVVRLDNRDIGRSSRIDRPVKIDFPDLMQKQARGEKIDAPYTLRDMAGDVVGLMDHLGVARAHTVGASMGGMIGQEMAMHFPDRLLSLTSIMSSTGNPASPPPTPEAAAVLLTPPPTTREEYVASFARTWRVLRAGAFPQDEAKDAARAARIWERGLNPMGVARQMLAVFASGDRRAGLAHVRAPTLVVHGDVDPLVRLEAGKDTAASIPGARLIVVSGMGHALPIALWPQILDAVAGHAMSAG